MKAAVVEQPGKLALREIPMPEPGDYEVLCRLLYGATCTGTDLHLIDGTFPWPVNYPILLGHESIGRVLKLGPKVRHYRVGDLVTRVGTPAPAGSDLSLFCGGFAEYGIAGDHRAMLEDGLPAERANPYRINAVLPPEFDPAAATMITTWRETLSYLTRMGLKTGDRALVIGSGGNALAFAAHAVNLGTTHVAVLGSEARRDAAKALGVHTYLDYRAADPAKALTEVCPEGFDVAIDAVGKPGQADLALAALKPGGVIGVYGLDDFNALTLSLGKIWKPFRFHPLSYEESETHDAVVEFVRAGKLRADPFMDLRHPFELDNLAAAFDHVRQRKAVKALVRLSRDDP